MPVPPTNRFADSPLLDATEPSPAEDVPKIRSKAEKKRKKHEAALAADQTHKEKATPDVVNDALVKSRANLSGFDLDCPSRALQDPSPFEQPDHFSDSTARSVTSPVFAALGEAFREKPASTFSTPPQNPIDNSPPAPALSDPSFHPVGGIDASPRFLPSASPLNEEARGGFSNQSPSSSPQQAYRLPTRRASGYQALADPAVTSPRGRPVSMPSQFYNSNPPVLNLNQLRGVRDADLGLDPSRSTSRKAGHEDFACLDSLALAVDDTTSSAENVLLASSSNNLHIFRVERDKAAHIGGIEGLRGTVLAAKLLPCATKQDSVKALRPLVMLVVHGRLQSSESASRRGSTYSSDIPLDQTPQNVHLTSVPIQYQTTVEIYSLRNQTHVATLYSSPPADVEPGFGRHTFEAPSPIGDLNICAKGRFVVVSCGVSGEVYVYDSSGPVSHPFRCIGKTWTSIPQRKSRTWSSSSASSEAETDLEKSPARQPRPEFALVSLSNRWLAYVPPVPPSRSTLFGKVDLPRSAKGPPGFSSHTASSQPQTTCELETPLEESRVNRVARDVTQEMLRGARWVGDQGKQAWKSYWNKSPEPTPHEQLPHSGYPQFPPTHASNDQTRIAQQPTVVSILDLEKLSENQEAKHQTALQPIATFSLPGGCSFLSLNPSGLSLLTVSTKGDVQYVWDLMQMVSPRSTLLSNTKSNAGPIVRQVARFTRVTVANVLDAIWLEPRGEKLAIVTDRGTVHIHDLPQSALQWPPPARVLRASDLDKPRSATVTSQPTSGGWNSAFNAVSGGLAAVRTNPLMGFGGFNLAQASAGVGARGSKMMASGFSKSVEAAAGFGTTLMHMGETRIHVPGTSRNVKLGCARWWTGKEPAVAVCGNGVIRIHRIVSRTETNKNGKKKSHSVVGERLAELSIPELGRFQKHQEDLPNDGINVAVSWPSPPHVTRSTSTGYNSSLNPLSFAEIDSCTPYHPFHMDRRVGLYAYVDSSYRPGPYDKWVFGEEVPTLPIQDMKSMDSELVSLGETVPIEEVEVAMADTQAKSTPRNQAEPKLEETPLVEGQDFQQSGPQDYNESSNQSDTPAEVRHLSTEGESSPAAKGKKKGKKDKKKKGKAATSLSRGPEGPTFAQELGTSPAEGENDKVTDDFWHATNLQGRKEAMSEDHVEASAAEPYDDFWDSPTANKALPTEEDLDAW